MLRSRDSHLTLSRRQSHQNSALFWIHTTSQWHTTPEKYEIYHLRTLFFQLSYHMCMFLHTYLLHNSGVHRRLDSRQARPPTLQIHCEWNEARKNLRFVRTIKIVNSKIFHNFHLSCSTGDFTSYPSNVKTNRGDMALLVGSLVFCLTLFIIGIGVLVSRKRRRGNEDNEYHSLMTK